MRERKNLSRWDKGVISAIMPPLFDLTSDCEVKLHKFPMLGSDIARHQAIRADWENMRNMMQFLRLGGHRGA